MPLTGRARIEFLESFRSTLAKWRAAEELHRDEELLYAASGVPIAQPDDASRRTLNESLPELTSIFIHLRIPTSVSLLTDEGSQRSVNVLQALFRPGFATFAAKALTDLIDQAVGALRAAPSPSGASFEDRRDQYLEHLYRTTHELYEFSGGGVDMFAIGHMLDLSDSETSHIVDFFIQKSFIQRLNVGGAVKLLHGGIEYVETRRRLSTQPTVTGTSDPPELAPFLTSFRTAYPNPKATAFIAMRFKGEPLTDIARAVKDSLKRIGIIGLRADDRTYSEDLLPNIRTYMHGCGFCIAIFDRIESEAFNANVALEVGYMMALGKPVFLLKDKTLTHLHADLIGRIHFEFDTRSPESIEAPLHRWLLEKALPA